MGEDALFEADEEAGGELETFGAVESHELNAVSGALLAFDAGWLVEEHRFGDEVG